MLLILANVGFKIEREVNGAVLLPCICLNSSQCLSKKGILSSQPFDIKSVCALPFKKLIHSVYLVFAISKFILIQYHRKVRSFTWTEFSSSSTDTAFLCILKWTKEF